MGFVQSEPRFGSYLLIMEYAMLVASLLASLSMVLAVQFLGVKPLAN